MLPHLLHLSPFVGQAEDYFMPLASYTTKYPSTLLFSDCDIL